MSLQKFGLRYERLLIISAPISLICILVAFISIASEEGGYKRRAACYSQAAAFIDNNKSELDKLWEKREMIGKKVFANEYVSETSRRSIGQIDYECDHQIIRQDTNTALSPEKFAEFLKNQAKIILTESEALPVRSYGIEVPQKATISLAGIGITANIVTFSQAMQLVLLPVLLLWLGSLFNTRYRETILIESAKGISDLYPHIINIYLNSKMPELRKKSWLSHYVIILIRHIPALFRIALLSIIILPPTIFYGVSLFYLETVDYSIISFFGGALVAMFSLVNLMNELQAWHVGKTFPGPICFRSQA